MNIVLLSYMQIVPRCLDLKLAVSAACVIYRLARSVSRGVPILYVSFVIQDISMHMSSPHFKYLRGSPAAGMPEIPSFIGEKKN